MKKCFELNKIVVCPICQNKVRVGDTISSTRYICQSCWEKTHKKGE